MELIKITNGNIEMTSRDVAKYFRKKHNHVMRDIRNEIERSEMGSEKAQSFFGPSTYKDNNNRKRDQYQLTKKGILQITARYDAKTRMLLIDKIEELENNQLPKNYIESLEKLLESEKEKQLLLTENNKMKPKADFFDAVADSKTAIEMGKVAKVLGIKGYGRNNLFEFLRNAGILRNNNEPYQTYVDRGYFRVVEQKYNTNGETRISIKTLVYQKGLDYIRKLIEQV
ncbi:MAG: phage regulatory protein/antirepressor Ant [Candidatus Cloacimonadota bacterium]|nr:phage regulatory protein/antirepressor Ant [Candidatus Cloacimonadota bacterium]